MSSLGLNHEEEFGHAENGSWIRLTQRSLLVDCCELAFMKQCENSMSAGRHKSFHKETAFKEKPF